MQAAGGTSIARATYVPVRKLYVFVFLRLSLVSYIWYLVYDRHAPTSRHTGLLKCVPGIMCTVPTGGEKVRRIDYKILNFCLRTWSNGGIPPAFFGHTGEGRKNTPAGDAPKCPSLPQIQFRRTGKVPAAHGKHAHLFSDCFSGTLWGAEGTVGAQRSPC